MDTTTNQANQTLPMSIAGKSPWSEEIRRINPRLADGRDPVLITGPRGAGKETIARSLHFHGSRSERRFVVVDCADLCCPVECDDGLRQSAEQVLFDCLEAASGGTLYIDEIGTLDPRLQLVLLEYIRSSGAESTKGSAAAIAPARLIFATAGTPAILADGGLLIEGLAEILLSTAVLVPPLRERPEDIGPLGQQFLADLSSLVGGPPIQLAPAAWRELQRHCWPANADELRNVLERAAAMAAGGPIGVEHLVLSEPETSSAPEPTITLPFSSPTQPRLVEQDEDTSPDEGRWPTLAEIERAHIEQTLAHTGGDEQVAAELLDMNWFQFQERLDRYELRPAQTLSLRGTMAIRFHNRAA